MLKRKTMVIDLTQPEGFKYVERAFRLPMSLSKTFFGKGVPSSNCDLLIYTTLGKVRDYHFSNVDLALDALEHFINLGRILYAVIYVEKVASCAWCAFGNKNNVCFDLIYTQIDYLGNSAPLPVNCVRSFCERSKRGV